MLILINRYLYIYILDIIHNRCVETINATFDINVSKQFLYFYLNHFFKL